MALITGLIFQPAARTTDTQHTGEDLDHINILVVKSKVL